MTDMANTNFKLKLSSFISGSFNDNSAFSPWTMSPTEEETEVVTTRNFASMRSSLGPSLGSPLKSPGQVDSPYSSVQGADVMTASIEAQQLAIVGLRRGWLAPMKVALDATGRLSDVARCYRLSRLLEVNQEALSIEEELKKYLASAANQRLGADLKMAMDSILKESRYLQEESEGKADNEVDNRAIELKIYYLHESLERILRSLLFILASLNSGGSTSDDSAFQFDRLRPTIMNLTAVETLLMALPQKYNLEVIGRP